MEHWTDYTTLSSRSVQYAVKFGTRLPFMINFRLLISIDVSLSSLDIFHIVGSHGFKSHIDTRFRHPVIEFVVNLSQSLSEIHTTGANEYVSNSRSWPEQNWRFIQYHLRIIWKTLKMRNYNVCKNWQGYFYF